MTERNRSRPAVTGQFQMGALNRRKSAELSGVKVLTGIPNLCLYRPSVDGQWLDRKIYANRPPDVGVEFISNKP